MIARSLSVFIPIINNIAHFYDISVSGFGGGFHPCLAKRWLMIES